MRRGSALRRDPTVPRSPVLIGPACGFRNVLQCDDFNRTVVRRVNFDEHEVLRRPALHGGAEMIQHFENRVETLRLV